MESIKAFNVTADTQITGTDVGSNRRALDSYPRNTSTDPLYIEYRKIPMSLLIDEVSSSITYVCEAPVGSDVTAAVWRCKRMQVSGTVTRIQWAGSGLFNQIANNRSSLTYV